MKISCFALALLTFTCAHFSQAQTASFDNTDVIYLDQMYLTPVTSEITVSGYPGEIISSTDNFSMARVVIEQSSMESLEVWIECPNGSQAVLINSYAGPWESIPGGVPQENWGGTYLGDPTLEDVEGTPGIGWEYAFSTTLSTWEDMATELVNENFVPATEFGEGGNSMNPNGVYLPYLPFEELVGCPIDGVWTLHIQDNVDFNNGTLFSWGMDLDLGSSIASTISQKASIKVYPNPSTTTIKISVPKDMTNENYVIMDELGSIVLQGRASSLETQVDVSSLEQGIYFIRLGASSENTVRFIKN